MSIWGKILGEGGAQILKPISDIIDNVTTNKEEKAAAETKLKEVIFAHEAALEQEWSKREAALLNDVANARAMNMKSIDSQDKFIRRFQYYLAAFIMVSIFAIIVMIISGEVSEKNENIVYAVLGFLTSSALQVLSFFYGSTRGSENKNETIKNLSKNSNGT